MSKLIAFVGNPNVGKSVIFNKLTGQYAVVSNYAGTTVDVTRGNITIGNEQYQVTVLVGAHPEVPESEGAELVLRIVYPLQFLQCYLPAGRDAGGQTRVRRDVPRFEPGLLGQVPYLFLV